MVTEWQKTLRKTLCADARKWIPEAGFRPPFDGYEGAKIVVNYSGRARVVAWGGSMGGYIDEPFFSDPGDPVVFTYRIKVPTTTSFLESLCGPDIIQVFDRLLDAVWMIDGQLEYDSAAVSVIINEAYSLLGAKGEC